MRAFQPVSLHDLAFDLLPEDARDAEVRQHHVQILVNEEVARLDVPVDDPLAVDVVEGGRQLLEPAVHHVLVDVLQVDVLHRVGLAVLVRDEIHHEVRHLRLVLEAEVEDVREVRMLQPRQQLSLFEELLLERVVGVVVRVERERLKGIVGAEFEVFHLVHRPHPALPEQADHPVVADDASFVDFCHVFLPLFNRSYAKPDRM